VGLRQRLSGLGRRYSCAWLRYQVIILPILLILELFFYPYVFLDLMGSKLLYTIVGATSVVAVTAAVIIAAIEADPPGDDQGGDCG